MKKLLAVLLCIAALAMLVACSQEEDLAQMGDIYQQDETPDGAEADTFYEPDESDEPDGPEVSQAEEVVAVDLSLLTCEDFLYDVDYMMQILEENFPMFGVAYRRFGVDLREKAELTRNAIADVEGDISVHDFFDILQEYFFSPAAGIGFLELIDESGLARALINWIGSDEAGFRMTPHVSTLFDAFTRAESVAFYGSFMYGGRVIEIDFAALAQALAEPGDEALRTEIIADGTVAYIRFPSAMIGDGDDLHIREFMDETNDFDHLILDFRSVRGGMLEPRSAWTLFVNNLLLPNLAENVYEHAFMFLSDGEHSQPTRDSLALGSLPFGMFVDIGITADMPLLNSGDLEFFDHAFEFEFPLRPPVMAEAFDGTLWLLLESSGELITELVAWYAIESGQFIIVGEAVGGRGRAGRAPVFGFCHVSLPNSGIIVRYGAAYLTDRYGRNLEEAETIAPHHFNRDGMDALETALALIAEGRY
ncbi:MAG: hypothetical protein FWB97_04455 [Oscillospiraceae bacterium]|nr:hypothetical protein [Oscillospiraceae bacterium]